MKIAILCLSIFMAASLAAFPAQDDGRGDDGHFHDPETGAVQPDKCDNYEKNQHPCTCNRADQQCDHDSSKEHPSRICKTWCRTNACGCLNKCGS